MWHKTHRVALLRASGTDDADAVWNTSWVCMRFPSERNSRRIPVLWEMWEFRRHRVARGCFDSELAKLARRGSEGYILRTVVAVNGKVDKFTSKVCSGYMAKTTHPLRNHRKSGSMDADDQVRHLMLLTEALMMQRTLRGTVRVPSTSNRAIVLSALRLAAILQYIEELVPDWLVVTPLFRIRAPIAANIYTHL